MNSNVEKKWGNCISSQYLSLGVTLFTKRMFKKLALATTVSLFSQVVSSVIMLTKYSTACVLWNGSVLLTGTTLDTRSHVYSEAESDGSPKNEDLVFIFCHAFLKKIKEDILRCLEGWCVYLAIQRLYFNRKCIR